MQPFIDERPVIDQDPLDLPPAGPDIDFAGLALADTMQLDVPEPLDNDFDFTLTRFIDPQATGPRGYFQAAVTPRQSLSRLRTMRKDVVFLIDQSTSINQVWFVEMINGVRQSLRSLNEGDRFNIVLFSEDPFFLSTDGPLPMNAQSLRTADTFLDQARDRGLAAIAAGRPVRQQHGGVRFSRGASGPATEIVADLNAAFVQLLSRDVEERVYNLVLISDGQLRGGNLDTRQTVELITRDNALASGIFCVAVGSRPDRAMLDFLAHRNKGFVLYPGRASGVQPAMRDLMSRIRFPIIRNVQAQVAGPGVGEVYPIHLPDIYMGQTLSVFGRFDRDARFTLQLLGVNSGREVSISFTGDTADAASGAASMPTQWANWKLYHLHGELLRRGQQPDLLQQIEALRRQYRLTTP